MTRESNDDQQIAMRKCILEALERLLEQKPYSEILLSEIYQEAHVSKTTFYRYFKSKDDIIHWLVLRALSVGLGRIGRGLNWYQGFLETTRIHEKHRVFFCDPQTKEMVADLLSFSGAFFIESINEALAAKGVVTTPEISYEINFVAAGLGVISRQWAVEGMVIPAEKICKIMVDCIPPLLRVLVCP